MTSILIIEDEEPIRRVLKKILKEENKSYNIYEAENGKVGLEEIQNNKKIDIVLCDIKYGRTVYSLLYGLSNYDVNVHLISPESLKIRSDSTYNLKENLS